MGVSFIMSVRLFAYNNSSTRQLILLQFFLGGGWGGDLLQVVSGLKF